MIKYKYTVHYIILLLHNAIDLFSGAGKTYTMLGIDNNPGIMARALNDLFLEMDKTSEEMVYNVSMSYLEVSNHS